jgi:steroid delta-isomerase-like uncharacterized protein
MTMQLSQLSKAELDAKLKLLEEHVQAEVDHDLDAIMRTWGRNAVLDDVAWHEEFSGRDEVREHYDELLKAFPDLNIVTRNRFVADDAVILEVVVSGTHTGQWRDLPPMGRWTEFRVCALYRFDDEGMLELERAYYDKATVLEQLGIFQDPRKPLGKVMAVLTPPFALVKAFVRKALRRS